MVAQQRFVDPLSEFASGLPHMTGSRCHMSQRFHRHEVGSAHLPEEACTSRPARSSDRGWLASPARSGTWAAPTKDDMLWQGNTIYARAS